MSLRAYARNEREFCKIWSAEPCLWQNLPVIGAIAQETGDIRGQASSLIKLDRYDRAIVRALQLDGRITNSQLADAVSLSESACLRRVRALEESGFIEGYTALINQQKAGCPVSVFVNITLERQEQAHLHAFEEAARKVPEVMECYLMSGEYDYLLRVVLADTADFERLHSQHLTRLPHVARVQSSFALRTVQKSRELPVR